MKICIVFGHYNTKNSFNASVRDTFNDEAKKIIYILFHNIQFLDTIIRYHLMEAIVNEREN